MDVEDIRREVEALGVWFHNMDLGGVMTAPDHFLHDYPGKKWARFSHAVPADLRGKTVLDIGCNAGFYALEMKRRGADRVVAIDSDERYLAQGRLAARVKGLDIEFRHLSVYDVARLGEGFDLVIFMGVFYHLRHPLLALDLIRAHVARDLMLFQTMQRGVDDAQPVAEDYDFFDETPFARPGYPKMHFIEHRYAGDPSNWWAPNPACAQAMLRSAGFRILGRPEAEVYLCAVDGPGAAPLHPVSPRAEKAEGA